MVNPINSEASPRMRLEPSTVLTVTKGFPVLPIIVGAILGPEMERQLRRSLQISAGDPAALRSEPVAVVVYTVIVLFLVGPPLVKALRRRFGRGGPTDGYRADESTVEFDAFGTQTSDGSARVIRVVRSAPGRRAK
jgi:putative tricarboxylic transport membrane protein